LDPWSLSTSYLSGN